MYIIDQAVFPDPSVLENYMNYRVNATLDLDISDDRSLINATSTLRHATKRTAKLVEDVKAHYDSIRVGSVVETEVALMRYLQEADRDIRASKSHLGDAWARLTLTGGVDYIASTSYELNHSLNLAYSHCIHRSVTYPRMLLVADTLAVYSSQDLNASNVHSNFALITPEGEIDKADLSKLVDMCPSKTICEMLWVVNTAVRVMNAS